MQSRLAAAVLCKEKTNLRRTKRESEKEKVAGLIHACRWAIGFQMAVLRKDGGLNGCKTHHVQLSLHFRTPTYTPHDTRKPLIVRVCYAHAIPDVG